MAETMVGIFRMSSPEERTRNLIGVAVATLFLLCFAGAALTMLRPMFVSGLTGSTAHKVVIAVVVFVFVISPLLTIVQVIRHYKKQPHEASQADPEPAPSGEVIPGYREMQMQEADYHKLKSDSGYWVAVILGPVLAIPFIGVGIFQIVDGNPFFGLPFLLAGLAVGGYSLWCLLQIMLVGKTRVQVSKKPVRSGDELVILVHHSRALIIDQLTVDYILRKHDSRGEGTSTTEVQTIPLLKLTGVKNNPDEPVARIKAQAPDLLEDEKEKWVENKWAVRVKMDLRSRPNRKQYFELPLAAK